MVTGPDETFRTLESPFRVTSWSTRGKTHANGNTMLQSQVSKLLISQPAGRYSRTAAVGKTGKF